jgi:hypothetical protein
MVSQSFPFFNKYIFPENGSSQAAGQAEVRYYAHEIEANVRIFGYA